MKKFFKNKYVAGVRLFIVTCIVTWIYLTINQVWNGFKSKYDDMHSPYNLRRENAILMLATIPSGEHWYQYPLRLLQKYAYSEAMKVIPKNDAERYVWEIFAFKGTKNYYSPEKFLNMYKDILPLSSKNEMVRKGEKYVITYGIAAKLLDDEEYISNNPELIKYLLTTSINLFNKLDLEYLSNSNFKSLNRLILNYTFMILEEINTYSDTGLINICDYTEELNQTYKKIDEAKAIYAKLLNKDFLEQLSQFDSAYHTIRQMLDPKVSACGNSKIPSSESIYYEPGSLIFKKDSQPFTLINTLGKDNN